MHCEVEKGAAVREQYPITEDDDSRNGGQIQRGQKEL
jgi:hypothetical protein